jgi:hypothetical protein
LSEGGKARLLISNHCFRGPANRHHGRRMRSICRPTSSCDTNLPPSRESSPFCTSRLNHSSWSTTRNQLLHDLIGSLPRLGSDLGQPGFNLGSERNFHSDIVGGGSPISNPNHTDRRHFSTSTIVTSNLDLKIAIADHNRGRDGAQRPRRPALGISSQDFDR